MWAQGWKLLEKVVQQLLKGSGCRWLRNSLQLALQP